MQRKLPVNEAIIRHRRNVGFRSITLLLNYGDLQLLPFSQMLKKLNNAVVNPNEISIFGTTASLRLIFCFTTVVGQAPSAGGIYIHTAVLVVQIRIDATYVCTTQQYNITAAVVRLL